MINDHSYKLLITAGCSFTQVPNININWPAYLQNRLGDVETLFLGQGAVGNGIISRKVIYNVIESLKTYKANEILVGIMWSGSDRHEIYNTRKDFPYNNLISFHENYRNPVKIVKDYNWYLINSHWEDDTTQNYIRNFYDEIGSVIITLEHILRTQWFLKQNNISYFMTEFKFDCLPRHEHIINHSDVSYLLQQIDKTHWLNMDNMYQFAIDTGLPFRIPNDNHPSDAHNEMMVDNILIPHLKNKGYI